METKQEEIELMAFDIIKHEILEKEHTAYGNIKQAEYCGNKQVELFKALDVITKGRAMEVLNDYSEKNYDEVSEQVLKAKINFA